MEIFDVLIVYSAKLATSANSLKEDCHMPFAKGSKNESYNVVYGYLLKSCSRTGLKAAFTTSADIVGAGKCSSYWVIEKNNWIKVNEPCYSTVIFDKFSPTNEKIKNKRDLLFSSSNILPFNNLKLYEIFFDKQQTYKALKDFSIPSISINTANPTSISNAIRDLEYIVRNHPNRKDFSDLIIMKDRFGAGGNNIFKYSKHQKVEMLNTLKRHPKRSFIIQPFIEFDHGFTFEKSNVSADIRLIFNQGEIVQTYIRMAKHGDFRCNEHQGGRLKYLSINEIPAKVLNIADTISLKLKHHSSLYALDFIISNNDNIYLLEGNTGPGLDWNLALKENEIEAKKLIRIVINKLRNMVDMSKTSPKINLNINLIPLLGNPSKTPDGLFLPI